MVAVFIKTFGCKVNLCDSRALAERLAAHGMTRAGSLSRCDAVVVNSCAVTARAVAKYRKFARSVMRDRPGVPVALYGCGPAVPGKLPEPEGTASFLRGQEDALVAFLRRHATPAAPACENVPTPSRTRAFIKIGDGCPGGCTYCIIPTLRGPVVSRPLSEIVDEARTFSRNGHGEIVLTAIHLGLYGTDLGDGGPRLADVVAKLCDLPELGRLRLSSIEALEVTDAVLPLSGLARLAPHLHLPLQSGDSDVLRAMGRRYDAGQFLDKTAEIRSRFPGGAITTDVIVGFPGETEKAFENTLKTCEKAGFSRIHAFPFSPRQGTPAATMPGRPPATEVRRRMEALLKLGETLAANFRESRAGKTDLVLAERVVESAPDHVEGFDSVYQRVRVQGSASDLGDFIPVRIIKAEKGLCYGERV